MHRDELASETELQRQESYRINIMNSKLAGINDLTQLRTEKKKLEAAADEEMRMRQKWQESSDQKHKIEEQMVHINAELSRARLLVDSSKDRKRLKGTGAARRDKVLAPFTRESGEAR